MPLNVDVGLAVLLKEPPVPETTLHDPVPTVAEFAARVTVVNPQVADPV